MLHPDSCKHFVFVEKSITLQERLVKGIHAKADCTLQYQVRLW